MSRPCDECGHKNAPRKRRKPHECDTCCVCDQHCERDARFDCGYNAFPNESGPPCRPLPECYRCGQKVCRNCSSKRKYHSYGKQRLCNSCQIEEDGHSRRVMYRIARRSNYDHQASLVIARRGY